MRGMQVHYFAAARAAAGVAVESRELVPNTLGELLEELAAEHSETTAAGMTLSEIFGQCSFLADGHHVQSDASLAGVDRVDVLPPFAGG